MRPVTVRVPATSANLGPGFDCLGMALSLCNQFTFEPADRLCFEGCEPRFATEEHLAWRAYADTMASLGLTADPVRISQCDGVPLAGGLGSSSTCLVAGIAAALAQAGPQVGPQAELQAEPQAELQAELQTVPAVDRHAVLERAAALEGHPDNVAPAVLGGVVSAFVTREGEVVAQKLDVAPNWRFVAVIPPYEVRTEDARRVMPDSVPLKTVVWSQGRSMAVVRALASGDGPLLRKACDDRLHEPYRRGLIPDFDRCKRAALAGGAWAFWISGSGSTMMAACTDDESACHVAAAMPASCTVLLLQANNAGMEVLA